MILQNALLGFVTAICVVAVLPHNAVLIRQIRSRRAGCVPGHISLCRSSRRIRRKPSRKS